LRRRHFIAGLYIPWAAGPSWSQTSAAPGASRQPKILVLGDSLSAEYGLRRGTGWVSLLEQRLSEHKISAQVRNASISGDTTSGGRARLPALLRSVQPSHVLLELGGNDALRGLPLKNSADNLAAMVQASQAVGAKVLLIGMQMPPNYGADYGRQFATLFADVARAHKANLVPFLLKGVADAPNAASLFQADRIHPREEAQPIMLDNVWPELRKLLV
jgi:acyl-CoA thioesterase-1